MKKTDTAKIGIGLIGAGIIGYGLYSMKKDTEKLLEGPANFIEGLFDLPDKLLGGSGLPGDETEPVNSGSSTKPTNSGNLTKRLYEYAAEKNPLSPKNLDNYYDKSAETAVEAASWTWDKYTDFLKSNPLYGTKLGVSLLPGGAAAVGITRFMVDKTNKMFIKESSPSGSSKTGSLTIVPSSSIKPSDTILDVKKSLDVNIPMSGASPVTKYTEKATSSSSSYTDSTGRVYTPTSVIKARW